jgi:hypothetical protein
MEDGGWILVTAKKWKKTTKKKMKHRKANETSGIQMKTRKHVRKKSHFLFESKCVQRKLVADLRGFDLLLDRGESVGDRRKSSGSGPRTMTSGKMSERMTSCVMSGKISGVEAVSRSKNST